MAPTQAPLPLEGKKERTRRARLLRALLVLLLLFVGSMGGGLSWFQAKWGQDWLHAFVEGQVRHMMGEGGFEIGGVDADQWGVIELSDVVLTDGTDREVVRLDRVRAEYRVDLDEQRVVVDELLVRGGEVDLLLDEEGLLDLERMFPPSGKDPFELPGDVQLRSIVIQDVHWAYTDAEQTLAMGTLGLNATGAGSGTVWSFDIVSGGGVLEEPTLGDYQVSGEVAYDLVGTIDIERLDVDVADSEFLVEGSVGLQGEEPTLDLTVDAALDLDGLERMTGDVGTKGRPNAELGLVGPLSEIAVTGRVLHESGSAGVDLVVGLEREGISYRGKLTPRELELMGLLDSVTEPTTLTGEVELKGVGVTWPEDMTANGTVLLSDSVGWGYALPQAEATWELEAGLITLTGFRYSADWCEVTGTGRLTETWMDVDVDAACNDLSGLAEFEVPGVHGSSRVTGRLLADWSEVVTADFDGYAVASKLGYADYAVVQRYEGPLSADWDETTGATAVGTVGALEGISSYGAFITTAEAGWEATLALDSSITWRAEFTGRDAVYTEATLAEAKGLGSGSFSADGSMQAQVDVELVSAAYERFGAEWGTASITVVDTKVDLETHLFDGNEGVLHLDGGGDYEQGTYRFTDLRAGLETAVQWEADRPVIVRLTEFGVADLDLAMTSPAGSIEAKGTLATEGPVEATVHAQQFQVAYLSYLFPEYGTYVGSIDADLVVGGAADAVELDGTLRATSVMVPGKVWGLSGVVEMESAPGQVLLDGRLDDQEGHLLAFRAALPAVLDLENPTALTRGPVEADAMLQRSDSQRLLNTLPILGELPRCEVAGRMQLGGTLMNPRVEVSAGLFVAGGDPQEWFRMDADLLLEEGELTLKANGYDRGTRLLTVDGGASTKVEILTGWLFEDGAEPDMARVQTWMPNFELRIVPLFIPVEKLGYFVKMPPDLEGKVSGAVRISGNPERPEFGGGIQLTEASVGDVTIAPAVVGLSPAEGGYSIFGTFGFSDQEGGLPAMLSLRGTVPFVLDLGDFDLNREMAREGLVLSVEGDGIPVAMARLVDPAITDASGLIHIDGGVAGSLAAPWPNLKIDMVDGAFTYEELEVRFPHVHLDSTLVGNEWRLQSLRMDSEPTQASAFARLGGGIVDSATGGLIEGLNAVFNDVEPLPCAKTFGLEPKEIFVHGTTQIRGFELGRVNLDVCTRTAWVSATEEITLAVGTDLKMRGRWPELQVTGRSKVARGDMDFDESFFVDEGTLRVDPNLTILRTDVDETLARSAQSPDFWWPWDMHVEVDLNRASQLSAVFPLLSGYESLQLQELRLEDADVDGVMQVHMHEDLLEAYGEVTVMRGIVEVMNKDFRVEKGELIFSGDYENPALDLDASRNTGRYGIIGVRIGQTALVPSLEFYSEEDLTNTDILSILLVGVPTSQLQGGAGDIVAVVSLMAEGVLTEQAEGLAGNLFDSLQISTIGDAITDDSGQITGEQTDITATFGKKLGNRGYLEVEFDAVQDPGEEVSHWDLTLEFIVTRRLQAEFTKTAEDDQTGADLLYTWKF